MAMIWSMPGERRQWRIAFAYDQAAAYNGVGPGMRVVRAILYSKAEPTDRWGPVGQGVVVIPEKQFRRGVESQRPAIVQMLKGRPREFRKAAFNAYYARGLEALPGFFPVAVRAFIPFAGGR